MYVYVPNTPIGGLHIILNNNNNNNNIYLVKHIKYSIILDGIWNNKTSRKILNISKSHALLLDDSIYATFEYNLQFLYVYHSETPTSL